MSQKINTYHLNTTISTTSSSPTPQSAALEILRPHLPTCLPLYRRIQSGQHFGNPCLVTNLSLDNESPSQNLQDNQKVWCIAFSDRSSRPDTECWFYGNWEDGPGGDAQEDVPRQDEIDSLVRDIVLALKALGAPKSFHPETQAAEEAHANLHSTANGNDEDNDDDGDRDHGGFSRKDYAGHAADPNIMLWGAVHERSVPIFTRLGLLSYKYKTTLMPNFMFVWDVDAMPSEPATRPLPENLRWGVLEDNGRHFALVRSRTQIPRRDRTLAVLPSIGVFAQGSTEPISWTFVGVDGSLTTLHVEAEWRRRGLAKAITTKLFKEKMSGYWEDGMTKWAHGYVIAGNKESEGMCRSLGGKSDWEVFWLRVDLGLVE